MSHLKDLLLTMRPRQWTKNLILFAGIVFAQKLNEPVYLLRTFGAFLLFCLVSGIIYIFNDVMDINEDRVHPRKKFRPIASGKISIPFALTFAIIAAIIGITLSFLLGRMFGVCVLVYFALMLLYTRFLKHLVILDILVISMGFVLRAYAGTVANPGVMVSPWLLVCTMFLALFLAICKRLNEIQMLEETANNHRKVLSEYSVSFLNQMMAIVTSTTVVAYALYCVSEETIRKFHTKALILTFPFVLYGILRYLYLVYRKGEGGEPETILLKDKPTIINILLWLMAIVLIIYSPVKLDDFLHIGGF
jgi:4-hydroxybenzoate polyprenyltransferase